MSNQSKSIHLGFSALCGGVIASVFLFILSLPGIGMGIWPQSEFAVTALHFCAALVAIGLLLISRTHPRLIKRICTHSVVCIPLAIGLLSLLLAPFQDLPVRHLLGAPQNGEGVVLWFDWGLISAATLIIWRFPFWRKTLTLAALIAFAIVTAMTLANTHFNFRYAPYVFPDFLAPNLFACAALIFCAFKIRHIALKLMIAAIFYALLFATQNYIAIAFGLIGVPFFLILHFAFRKHETLRNRLSLLTLAALPVVALAGITALTIMAGDGGLYAHEADAARNILSRGYLMWIGAQPLLDQPLTALIGSGWGSYTEHAVQYLPTDWYDFTRDAAQWEGIAWDQFHTHDMFLDITFSIGALGLILFYSYFLFAAAQARASQKLNAYIFASSTVSIVSFWFLFPLNIPYIAIVFAALAKPGASLKCCTRIIKPSVLLCIILTTQIIAITIHIKTVLHTHRYDPMPLSIAEAQENCPMEYFDGGAGGLHLSKLLLARTRLITYKSADEEHDPQSLQDDILKLNHLYCQADKYAATYPQSKRLRVARLIAQGEVLLSDAPLDESTRRYYAKDWKENIASWLTDFPSRSDQAAPYLLYTLGQGQEQDVYDIASLIYRADPNHPIGLWFTGFTMLASPEQTQAGLSRMRSALDNSIERYIPIEDDIKRSLNPQ